MSSPEVFGPLRGAKRLRTDVATDTASGLDTLPDDGLTLRRLIETDDYKPPPLIVGPPIDRSIRGAVLCGGFRPDEVIFKSLRVPYDCAVYAELNHKLHRLADALNGTAPIRR